MGQSLLVRVSYLIIIVMYRNIKMYRVRNKIIDRPSLVEQILTPSCAQSWQNLKKKLKKRSKTTLKMSTHL